MEVVLEDKCDVVPSMKSTNDTETKNTSMETAEIGEDTVEVSGSSSSRCLFKSEQPMPLKILRRLGVCETHESDLVQLIQDTVETFTEILEYVMKLNKKKRVVLSTLENCFMIQFGFKRGQVLFNGACLRVDQYQTSRKEVSGRKSVHVHSNLEIPPSKIYDMIKDRVSFGVDRQIMVTSMVEDICRDYINSVQNKNL